MEAGLPHHLAGLSILVVEDELLCAMELEQLLGELDCKVVGPLARLDEVLPTVEGHPLDGAVLDVNLHGKRSYAVASALRSRHIPVVLVTGYGELPDCPEDLKRVPTVSKPFDRTQIATAIAAAIHQAEGG